MDSRPQVNRTTLLSLHGITKAYPTVVANEAIDLVVHEGSIHAVLGENGAGKSTLMKLAYGLIPPDAGEIRWQGERVTLKNPADARRLGIGMVFQHFSLFDTLTVVENIALTLPGSRRALARRIRDVGEQFSLTVNPHARVASLSVGERQRVEIIRCLLQDLKLLILDEPTSVLPPQQVRALFDALRRLRDSGVAILFISHKLAEIRELCDTATLLRGGRVTGTVDPRTASTEALATLMIGRAVPVVESGSDTAPSKESRLELRSLCAAAPDAFGSQLRDITLTVRGGEIVGIAGVSGNGQQELARLISGERIDRSIAADTITLLGQPAAHRNAAERRALGFAFVPEERLGRGAVPPMTLSRNTLLTAYSQGLLTRGFVRRRELNRLTDQCIDEFDVRCGGAGATARSLSGGNLQKFIIGRELKLRPTLLLVSQPTWGVDIGAATAIRQKLLTLRNEGVAILIISEDIDELFEITERLHVLHSGRLSPSLDTRDVTPNDIGEYMIGSRSHGPTQPQPQPQQQQQHRHLPTRQAQWQRQGLWQYRYQNRLFDVSASSSASGSDDAD